MRRKTIRHEGASDTKSRKAAEHVGDIKHVKEDSTWSHMQAADFFPPTFTSAFSLSLSEIVRKSLVLYLFSFSPSEVTLNLIFQNASLKKALIVEILWI